jgi:hypothetical protein
MPNPQTELPDDAVAIAGGLSEEEGAAVISARLHVSGGWRVHYKYAGPIMRSLTSKGILGVESSYLTPLGLAVHRILSGDS